MEYIISNKKFEGLKKWGNIYYKGDYKSKNYQLYLLEGEIFDDIIIDNNSVIDSPKSIIKKEHLKDYNVKTALITCSEIPLAVNVIDENKIEILDTSKILARAFIHESNPDKLIRQ